MKFKILKSSALGRNFMQLEARMKECHDEQVKLSEKYGFTSWRAAFWVFHGGISSVMFDSNEIDKIDLKQFRRSRDEWVPNKRHKEGKAVAKEFSKLPVINVRAVNLLIGFKDPRLVHPGVFFGNKDYILLDVNDEWDCEKLDPSQEITTSEYKALCLMKE